jgi:hypothetical protein
MARSLSKKPLVAKPLRFLSLPAEIRLKIFKSLFEGAEINVISHNDFVFGLETGLERRQFKFCARTLVIVPERGILMSCRLCREEGLETLWSCATWAFKENYEPRLHFSAFITRTAHQSWLHLIKHIEVFAFSYLSRGDFERLPNLKTLTIRMTNTFLDNAPEKNGGSIDIAKVHDKIINLWPDIYDIRKTEEETEGLQIRMLRRMTFFWVNGPTTSRKQNKLVSERLPEAKPLSLEAGVQVANSMPLGVSDRYQDTDTHLRFRRPRQSPRWYFESCGSVCEA